MVYHCSCSSCWIASRDEWRTWRRIERERAQRLRNQRNWLWCDVVDSFRDEELVAMHSAVEVMGVRPPRKDHELGPDGRKLR